LLDRQPLTIGGSVTGSTNQEFVENIFNIMYKISVKLSNIPLLHAIDGLPKYPGMHSQIPL
jgi:hypothetical protein